MATSTLALMMMLGAAPGPVDAATPTAVPATTLSTTKKSTAPAAPVPPEKKALDAAKDSVTTLTKKSSGLAKEIKAQKAADSKAMAALNKAEQTASRAKKTFEREDDFMMKMSPKTPVVTLQAQKSKVCT